jgi:hypothetical protein
MHMELPILAGHALMATDLLESQGHQLRIGNNMTINLELEERAETERLFEALSQDGSDQFGLQVMPWGGLLGDVCRQVRRALDVQLLRILPIVDRTGSSPLCMTGAFMHWYVRMPRPARRPATCRSAPGHDGAVLGS